MVVYGGDLKINIKSMENIKITVKISGDRPRQWPFKTGSTVTLMIKTGGKLVAKKLAVNESCLVKVKQEVVQNRFYCI